MENFLSINTLYLTKSWNYMPKKKKITAKDQICINARKQYHLSDMQIQMARELGLNPKRFGKLSNYKQEPWKLPLPDFIEKIYFKRFKKERPDVVKSVERIVKDRNKKREERKKRKAEKKALKQSKNELDEVPF